MSTESVHPRSAQIDQLATPEILSLMNDEDATVPAAVREALPAIAAAVDAVVLRLSAGGRLIYAGAGTSGRLAVLDAAECPPTFGTPPGMVQALIAGGPSALTGAVEGAEDDADAGRGAIAAIVHPGDVVVGVAASGRTPFVLGVVEAARGQGALTVGVSCNRPAPLLDAVEYPIAVVTGPEIIAGSTRLKAGTAQKLVLNMISTASMIRLGKVYGNRMVDMAITNSKLRARGVGMVRDLLDLGETDAERLLGAAGWDVKRAVLMGATGLDAARARAALAAAHGVLRTALETHASIRPDRPGRPGPGAPGTRSAL